MTLQDVNDRSFTYVQVFFTDTWKSDYWITPIASNPIVRARVAAFIAANAPDRELKRIHLYPRTYVVDARDLLSRGRVIPEEVTA